MWWGASRALVLAAATVVQWLGWPVGRHWHPGLVRHPFALLAIWDGRWYRMVAERGYLLLPGHQSDPAFFPLLPIVLRLGHALGLSLNAVGFLLGNFGLLAGLLALYELGRYWLPEEVARRAAVYATLFPFSFVFSMVYPEGLVFAALALAGLLALRERWLLCALCAGLAALGRPEGVFVALPIAVVAAGRWGKLAPAARAQAVAAIAAAPAVLASFSFVLWRTTGDALAWGTAERAWGRSFSPAGPYRAAVELATAVEHHKAWLFRDGAFFLLYAVSFLLALRAGIPRSWVAAGALMVVLPIASGSFTSEGRFGLLALPVYWGLASAARVPLVDRGLRLASSAALSAGVVVLFLRWP